MKKVFFKCIRFFVAVLAVSLAPVLCLGGNEPISTVPRTPGVSGETIKKMEALIARDTPRLQEIFKDIHQNPELGFMEIRTASIVASELERLGYKVTTGIGKTGVVGILKNGDGPTFMFRADMDANAVEEATGLPYASKVRVTNLDGIETPVAHMCGHDAHTTWLISLAKTMKELRAKWRGTLVLIAQPAEELIEGAKAMLDDGLYTRHQVPKPDYFLALHTIPLPTGDIIATTGRLTTGSEHIDVIFHGVGGHGSSPHHAKDPVVMAGMAIVQFQSIVSRRIDPGETGVLTIGAIQAGVDNNVIPTDAVLKLKLHYSTAEVHQQLVSNIKLISNSIARSNGVSEENLPTFIHKGYTPPMVNSKGFIDRIRNVLPKTDCVNQIHHDIQLPGSDDAAALVEGVDGVQAAYLFVGTADPKIFAEARSKGHLFPFSPHEPNYQVDLKGIPYGAKIAALLALDTLSH